MICGLSGGVDSAVVAVLLHEAIGDQLTCIFVDHGLLRQGEAEEVERLFRGAYNIPLIQVNAAPRFLVRACRRHRSREEAQDHRPAVHRGVRRGGAPGWRRGFPGAGHAVPGRDRERGAARRAVGDDQVAPQCRRLAGPHEAQARRAVARAVQGRGARAWPRAGAAGCVREAASVPRARPRHPHPRRDHGGEARRAAQGRRDLSGGAAQSTGFTTISGRRSPRCCRCRAWA